jgi:hypothetical protein
MYGISIRSFGKLLLGTAVLGGEIFLFSGFEGVVIFAAAALLAAWAHLAWLQELRKRFVPGNRGAAL